MNGDAPRVGYVGLGQMGSAMAGRLLETGVQLIVFDLNPETMAEAVGLGAEPAGSTAEVAAFADVVSICVPDAHHVSSVLDGLGEGAVVGLPVLVHSTIHPDAVAACRVQGFDAAVERWRALPSDPDAAYDRLVEIEAADLAGLALELAVWGAGPEALPFLTPPPEGAFAEAQALLRMLGALDGAGRITPHGRDLAALPLHPRLAHMLASWRFKLQI